MGSTTKRNYTVADGKPREVPPALPPGPRGYERYVCADPRVEGALSAGDAMQTTYTATFAAEDAEPMPAYRVAGDDNVFRWDDLESPCLLSPRCFRPRSPIVGPSM